MILILGGVIRNGNPWISYQINMQVYEYIFDMILVISKPPYFIHQSARYYAKRLNSMSFQCPTFGVKKIQTAGYNGARTVSAYTAGPS